MTSCSDASFTGKGARASAHTEEVSKTTEGGDININSNGKPIVVVPGEQLSGDDIAINKCLRKFRDHPFSPNQVQAYRKINTSVSVLVEA